MTYLILFCAQYLYLVIVLTALVSFVFLDKSKRINTVKLTALALPLSYIFAKVAAFLFYNPRPFVVEHIQPLIHHAADNGFPSDHTLLTMTIAAIVFAFNRKLGIFLGILAIIVGVARVVAHVHHPTDILGGIVISISSVYFSWYIIKKAKLLFNL